jgi:hypothetical protein
MISGTACPPQGNSAFRTFAGTPEARLVVLAKRIIALAKDGVRDPNLLCEWVLDDLRKQPPHV